MMILAANTTIEITVKKIFRTKSDKLSKKQILAILKIYWKCFNFPLSLMITANMMSKVKRNVHPARRVGMYSDAVNYSCIY